MMVLIGNKIEKSTRKLNEIVAQNMKGSIYGLMMFRLNVECLRFEGEVGTNSTL